MSKSVFITARIPPDVKHDAEIVLDALGITRTQAITMLYKRLAVSHEWPWKLHVPNAETRKAFEETDNGIGLTECDSADDMFKKIGVKKNRRPKSSAS